jgi:enamine deaminase RidA (YjgF/YER057c/UK114 family)
VTVRDRLAELGVELPPTAKPVASYVPVAGGGDVAFVAGQVPLEDGKPIATGRVGEDLSIEEGQSLARRCALQALAALEEELGSGASDLLVEVFGEDGKHARAAVGAPSLPLGVPVEVEMVVQVA